MATPSPIEIAVTFLSAEEVEGRHRYYADETQSYWLASESDMAELGRRIQAGGQDIYSQWCNDMHLVECDAA